MDVGTVTAALEALVTAQIGAGQLFPGAVVEREEFVNEDPDRAINGWFGIYRDTVSYNPATLAASFKGRYDLKPLRLLLVWQMTDSTAVKCADRLEDTIKNFIDLLLDNDSISNTIEQITKFDIKYGYEPRSKKGKLYMQSAYITLELEVANE